MPRADVLPQNFLEGVEHLKEGSLERRTRLPFAHQGSTSNAECVELRALGSRRANELLAVGSEAS